MKPAINNLFLKTRQLLSSKNTFLVLWLVFLGIIAFDIYLFRNDIMRGGDFYTYMYYTKGLHKGVYSYWYFLDDYIPDTFRNPGFAFVIYLLSFISESQYALVVVNFAAFIGAIWLMFKIIEKLQLTSDHTIKNMLMLLLILNAHLPFYINLYYPEVVMFFLIVLIVYLDLHLSKQKISSYIIMGLLYGFVFQVRPVILFYPFIKFGIDIFIQRKNFSILKNLTLLVVFVSTMLPYGYWNYKNHGIFSTTSLEGGGGVMHLSYWGFKMPDYLETRYWRNVTQKDLITFTPDEDVPKNIAAFNKEWDYIDSSCAKYLTDKDRRNLPLMRKNPDLFVTYNGRYTYEREKLLKKLSVQHFLNDPWFTLKVKTYTFFRLWVTGIKQRTFESRDPLVIFKGVVPAMVTGFTLLLALIFIPLAMIRRKFNYPKLLPALVLAAYYGMIHVPFAIQARYTVPVRPLLMMITVICIYQLYFRKEQEA